MTKKAKVPTVQLRIPTIGVVIQLAAEWVSCPDKKLNKKRFWVKLVDANKIICNTFDPAPPPQ